MAYTTIDDPSAHFQTALYTGTASSVAVTNGGNSDLQPDLVWIKRRDSTGSHMLLDSTRGVTKRLRSDTTEVEDTDANDFSSFNSDGFTVGTDDNANLNGDGNTYVGWQWKANGGTTSSNTSGTNIDSTVQANTTAGFSIATYTATGTSGDSFGHSLGVVPHFVIIKNRSEVKEWVVYHHKNTSAPETEGIFLSETDATIDNAGYQNDTAPTSTVFTLGDNTKVNSDGETHVAYCFTEIQGYSKFGSYTGNGTSSSADFDGPFVYTGFKPAWIMTKRSSASGGSWAIVDNKRDTTNPTQIALFANSNGADDTDKKVDFLSNGFKLRNSRDDFNTDGVTYIYMAFAEQPFVTSGGVPCTAK